MAIPMQTGTNIYPINFQPVQGLQPNQGIFPQVPNQVIG
jgi:hypothetical protein